MSNGKLTPFRAPQESPIAQLPVPGQEPQSITANYRDDQGDPAPITDESVVAEAENASGGITSILLLGAVGFGLYLAFRK